MVKTEGNLNHRWQNHATTCPYIGVPYDPDTHFSYSNVANFCHRVIPAEPVRLEHQEAYCLTTRYWDCPLMQESWQGRMPARLRGEDTRPLSQRPTRSWARILIAGLLVLVLVAALVWFGYYSIGRWIQTAPASQAGQGQSTLPLTATLPSTTTPVPATEVAALPPPAETAIPATIPPTAGPALETPFGPQSGFLLHTVLAGESLQSLVEIYHTSVEVLAAANEVASAQQTSVAVLSSANIQVSNTSLVPGTILVVLPGKTDPTGVPRFRFFQLEKAERLDSLANWLKVPANELRSYNSLGDGEWVPAGRWLIAPVAGGSNP